MRSGTLLIVFKFLISQMDGVIKMLNSIIKRSSRLSPMTETEIKVIKSAVKQFLQNGFSGTTIKMISDDTGIKPGNITYYYRTKEEMLLVLMQEIMDFHLDMIDEAQQKLDDPLVAYATEVTAQIALCETDAAAKDLYYSAYNHPKTFEHIKDWTAKKNFHLLGTLLPDLSEEDFRKLENVACCIELSAFVTACDRYFTLEDKIRLILDSLLKLFDIKKEERKRVVEEILKLDYIKLGKDMFEKFVSRLEKH